MVGSCLLHEDKISSWTVPFLSIYNRWSLDNWSRSPQQVTDRELVPSETKTSQHAIDLRGTVPHLEVDFRRSLKGYSELN